MSTNWHLHCVDCDVGHGFNYENHEHDFMLSLIRNRHELAEMDAVLNDLETGTVELKCSQGTVMTSWFKEHHEHHLVAKSEYGEIKESPDARGIVGAFVVVSNPLSEFYGWEGQIVDAKGQELKVQLLVELKTQAEPKPRVFKKRDLDKLCTFCSGSGLIARGATLGMPATPVVVNGESHSMLLQRSHEVFAASVRVCVCVTLNQKKVFG